MREEAVEAHAMRVLLAAAARWLGRRRAAAVLFQRAWAARDERRERRAERERARAQVWPLALRTRFGDTTVVVSSQLFLMQ
jgi:hypothetical protein